MMAPVHRIKGQHANAIEGRVRLDGRKILWNGPMLLGALAAPFFWDITAAATAFGLTYILLLLGHSIGLHRLLIHRSFEARPWLSRTLIGCGAMVGIDSPTRIIAMHDVRDWAQRQPHCHDFFSHRRDLWRDLTWQLFYSFDFDKAPKVDIESEWTDDPFFRHVNRFWRAYQIGLAAPLYLLGGWSWVLWCICVRITLTLIGHWTVTHICHRPGTASWHVKEAGVQASDLTLPIFAFLTQGECWHSNHHAFPESARIGLEKGQMDPAAWVIERFAEWGWVTRLGKPRSEPQLEDLIRLANPACSSPSNA